jgi:hypothetical protein
MGSPAVDCARSAAHRITDSFSAHAHSAHWIQSQVLSPDLAAGDIDHPEDLKTLSFSGLIRIWLGREYEGRIEESSISMIDRIRHEKTGDERQQPEYRRIFERLRRSMRKRLVVETESWPMTARSADAYARGEVTFTANAIGLRE